MAFLNFGFIDLLDILVVAYLFYSIYQLVRGTVAINIFTVIIGIYLIWTLVKAMNMQLLSTILGQFIGVGVLAIIIVFQPEIRRFFILIYSEYLSNFNLSIENIFAKFIKQPPQVKVDSIIKACVNMAKTKTGALIVITDNSNLDSYEQTGTLINADTTDRLLESLFYKNSPLHDGAVIVIKDKIIAAGCILPVSESSSLPAHCGLRHRSALGITEVTNSLAVVVSEETGNISYFKNGKFFTNVSSEKLQKVLVDEYINKIRKDLLKDTFRKLKFSPLES